MLYPDFKIHFNADHMFKRVDQGIQPALQKIAAKIDGYSFEEIRAIASIALDRCGERVLRMRERGCTTEETVEVVAYQEVIEPAAAEIAEYNDPSYVPVSVDLVPVV